MGMGILNQLEVARGDCRFKLLNVYLPPNTGGTGPATLLARIRRYQSAASLAPDLRRLDPVEFIYTLAQQWITEARTAAIPIIVGGDFNTPLQDRAGTAPRLRRWLGHNALLAPFHNTLHRVDGYCTHSTSRSSAVLDHIFHTVLPPTMQVQRIGTGNDPQYNSLSDHRPVWITLAFSRPLTPVPTGNPIRPPPRIDIVLGDTVTQARYASCLRSYCAALPARYTDPEVTHTVDDSCQFLAALSRLSVKAVGNPEGLDQYAKRRRMARRTGRGSRFKNGYSPQMRVLQLHMLFYQELLRVAEGGRTHYTRHWTPATYQTTLAHWITKWRTKHQRLLSDLSLTRAVSTPHPSHLLYRPFELIHRAYLSSLIASIKSQLHGRKRRQMRNDMSAAIRRIDNLRATNKIGEMIQALSSSPREHLDLDSLPCSTRGQIVDPPAIHSTLSDYFSEWYSSPPDMDAAAVALDTAPDLWQDLLMPPSPSVRDPLLHSQSAIPPPLQQGLRKACQVKVTEDQRQRIEATIQAPITFEQFNAEIDHLATGGAPGPSEATVNMLKAWPTDIRQLAHQHMTTIWTSRTSPVWFKDKIVKLAPKIPGNTDLSNMRPISLYEILRKLWTTIIAKRINLEWHNMSLLHASQYGYQLDNGTPMPLLNVLDEIEDAIHNDHTKHVTFWDIRRAFDSIPRNLQRLAWIRLGVPQDVAHWLVSLDDGGLSFIGSPHYFHTCSLRSAEELLQTSSHITKAPDLGFIAHRGIGQGESASSLLWVALYDILLEWIDPRNTHLHEAEDLPPYQQIDLDTTVINAYADDLATITGGPHAAAMQQQQATWLSAFCAFTGLTLHPRKIIATTIGPPLTMVPSLAIRDAQWKRIACTVSPDLASV